MKKLWSIFLLLSVFACQYPANEPQLNNDKVSMNNRDFISKSFDELAIDPRAATRMSLTEPEFERRLETCKQLILILNDLADEMPESLKNSDDWVGVMKSDPAAAEFGRKLKEKIDELPPLFQPDCTDLDTLFQLFNCLWTHVKDCVFVGWWDCTTGIMQILESAIACYGYPCSS